MFKDRHDAGKKLAAKLLEKYPKTTNGFVLALPRGGVVVGAVVSRILNLPLDIIVTRKIGAPQNPEYAVAAISANRLVLSEREKVDEGYLHHEIQKERQEIQRRMINYRGNRPHPNLQAKTIFLVDDGLATGLTMEVAIEELNLQKPAKIILAVPVAPPETVKKLTNKVSEIIVLKIEPLFFAVGQFYQYFDQVSDGEVKALLKVGSQE